MLKSYISKKFRKTLSAHYLFFCLISFVLLNGIFFLSAGDTYAGQAILSWNVPTTNTDGSPLTDLAGYKVYYGTVSGAYTQNIDVGNVTTYTVPNLTDGGAYYFAVTAYDTASIESGYSNEVSKTIGTSSQQYTLTVYRGGTGSGNVTSSPAGISCGTNCAAAYNSGTAVTLTAAPDASSTFAGWSGACTGTGTCSVTMSAAKSVTATFSIKTNTITASAGTGGSISPSGSVSVNYGANQSFTITANTGYSIADVTVDGASVGVVSTYTFSNVIASHTISASFTTNTYNLSVTKAGTGAGTITSSPAGISCGSSCSYAYNSGTAVTLTAAPDASSTFAGWSGACTGTGTCSVTMSAAKSVTATFSIKTNTITASAGTGGSISPSGSVSVNYGANQSFTITANTGYSIADVTVDGASVGVVSTYTFSNVIASHTISASFTTNTYNLSVTKAGTGAGTITSSPAGISCGSSCSYAYNSGTAVTLTAAPDASSTFAGWSGACTGTGTCSVTMSAAKSVTATFSIKTNTITASAGTGGSISPSGSVSVNYGANQSFTITANTGYSIADVTVDGASVGVVSTYTFSNVIASHTISASFTTNTYNLSVTKAGTGAGTITSSPAGISCGSSCSYAYNSGTAVTLTAAPDASSTFAGWSGACTGTGTCSVTMSAAKSVTATFSIKTNTITASAGTGGSISPSGSVSVNYGANQSFTITANNYYEISDIRVDGSSMGLSSSYTFTNVASNHVISVTFTASDSDSDGVSDVEEMGPNSDDPNYDGNGDGIPDRLQNNVASLHTYDGHGYVTLFSPTGQPLSSVKASQLPQEQIPNVVFPIEFIEFKIDNLGQGASTTITMKLPDGTKVDKYYKYGPTPDNPTPHWYDFKYDGQTGAEISGNIITLHFVDGLRGDDDITVNGQITDQGGPAMTADSALPVTGQIYSYATGDDGYIEAGIKWPNPRFKNNGDGTVTDNLTGLMWLKNGSCLKNNWTTALQTIASCNSGSVSCGCRGYTGNYSDWRLPNVKELESLINYGQSNSAAWLNSVGFINIRYSNYWSSTTYQGGTSNAWTVNINNGAETTGSKSYGFYILPVRTAPAENPYEMPKTGQTVSYASGDDGYMEAGAIWPGTRFTDNGDGTMTDSLTGLMWLKDAGCLSKNWSSALTAVASLNANPGGYNCLGYAANYSDWRLPNINEIESLINFGTANSTSWLSSQGFMNVKSSYYWSSTTYQNNTSQAWGIQMTKGQTTNLSKRYVYSAWPVRGGNIK